MTWNFAILAADQIINSAAKMLQMSGGQYSCPIVFRGGNGTAGQLAATHSQSFEAFYAHVPGLKVITPSNPYDAKGLLKAAIRDNDPVIFMESEQMYGDKMEVPEGEYTIPLGVADIKREGSDVTIVSFGKIIKEEVEDRFDHKNLNVDCAEFQDLLPSTEHFAKVIYDILKPKIGKEYQLHITLFETAKNAAECGDW
jgi:pyruvate dehydrogenase E1 component beta subunit